MKRLYYLTRNVQSTERIAEDLHREGITDWHFHVISKDEAGLQQHHVHMANLLHRFDVLHSGERGGLIGGTIGFAIGVLAVLFTPMGDIFGFWFLPLPTGLCGFFGAWVGGLVGLSHENYKIARFHDDIEKGRYLIMIDIRKDKEESVRRVMERLHPEARLAGMDSTWISPLVAAHTRSVYESSYQPGHIEGVRTRSRKRRHKVHA